MSVTAEVSAGVLFLVTWVLMYRLGKGYVKYIDEKVLRVRRETFAALEGLVQTIQSYRKESKQDREQYNKYVGELERDLEILEKKVNDLLKK